MISTTALISIISIFPVAVYTIANRKYYLLSNIKWLERYIYLKCVAEIIASLTFVGTKNNLVFFAIYTAFELYFIINILTFDVKAKRIYLFIASGLCFNLFFSLFTQPDVYPFNARILQLIFIVIITVISIIKWMQTTLMQPYQFAIFAGIFGWASFSILTLIGSRTNIWVNTFYTLQDTMNGGANLLFLFAFINYKKQYAINH